MMNESSLTVKDGVNYILYQYEGRGPRDWNAVLHDCARKHGVPVDNNLVFSGILKGGAWDKDRSPVYEWCDDDN